MDKIMGNLRLMLLMLFLIGCKPESKDVSKIISNQEQWNHLKDKEKIGEYFSKDGNVFCGEVQFNGYPMVDVDLKSFEVFGNTKYARDRNKVYYPLQITCVDGADWGVCYCSEYEIKKADLKTFEVLDNEYAKDMEKAYFRGRLINSSDGQSFRVIHGPSYFYFGIDKNYVYMHDKIFKEADPGSFMYDKNNSRNDTLIHRYVIKDKSNVWEYIPPDQITRIN